MKKLRQQVAAAMVTFMTVSMLGVTMVHARPVSYPGGWTIMQMNEMNESTFHLHYTTDPKTSWGIKIEDRRGDDFVFYGGQVNRLLKRWNKSDSQANVYLKLGLGVADGEFNTGINDSKTAGFVRFDADWETRRWFTAYGAHMNVVGDDTQFRQYGRVGFAPYVAEYGGTHTWLMLQVDHNIDPDPLSGISEFVTTPLVRVFKGPLLVEAGYSSDEELLFNWMVRF